MYSVFHSLNILLLSMFLLFLKICYLQWKGRNSGLCVCERARVCVCVCVYVETWKACGSARATEEGPSPPSKCRASRLSWLSPSRALAANSRTSTCSVTFSTCSYLPSCRLCLPHCSHIGICLFPFESSSVCPDYNVSHQVGCWYFVDNERELNARWFS